MHYFSLHSQNGSHLGFLIMLPDDENGRPPQSGRLAFKLENTPEAAPLAPYQGLETPLYWQVENGETVLSDGETAIGRIRQEWLTVGGHTFTLNDLAGSL
ncbi:hypothetical protein V6667_05520 [Neisseria leonii]|uniref:Uncharacterized protein n=1 Tax=Neisseria leonii TaxID=2995413 RepID=A0A9X4E2D6_9NEIS|nr:hypothetical protein [Neisseria sp. 51.81]MDD9328325.1 hypothetical protein [Neisseria sp. 51.81]